SNPSQKKINVDGSTLEKSLIAQAERDIFQHSVVTFTHTEIIQSSREDIKTRKFIEASPYKGLKRFDTEDKDLFFGRDEFLTGLVNELEQTNLILLLGASGSGKSSVVRAGLIPWLSQKWGSHFVKLVLTPDRDPFESFYASLLSQYKQGDAQIAREAKADTLTEVISKLKKPDEYWFILLDQFEELFTTSLSDKRDLFIKSLVELDKTQQNSVKVIATMRADFLDKLSPYRNLVKATDQHRPLIAEMQWDELRLALEQPAAHHGVIFEPELVPEILNDIKGQAGYLPLLQYTLNLLWETEVKQGLSQDRTLKLDIYHQIGGVQRALQKHVDTIYEGLSPDEQQATQRIFLRLVNIGEDTASKGQLKAVRCRISKALFTDELEQKVLAKLIDEKLLVSGRSLESQESTIDISHEILLTSWTTLNTWIQDNRKTIAIRNRLNHDLNLWKSQKSDAELWSGSKLEQVLELRIDPIFNEVLGGFSLEENQFIDLSRGLRDRQRRRTLIAVSSFSVFALILAAFAGWQWRSAEMYNLEISRRHSLSLLAQEQNFNALIEILRTATPFHNSFFQPPLSLRSTLIDAVYAPKEFNRLEGHQDWVSSIAFSPDSKTLASVSDDNTIKLWNVETGKEIHSLTGHQGGISSIAFSPEGKTLASVSGDTIKLWNVETGQEIHSLTEHLGGISSIAFNQNSKTMVFVIGDTIKLWNVETGQEIHSLTGHQGRILSRTFSPDGKTLASVIGDTIKLWNVETGKEFHSLTGHQGRISSIAFSSEGKTLASVSDDNTIKLWNVETGKEFHSWTKHQSRVSSIAFSQNGKTLVSVSNDNTIKFWNVETGEEIHSFEKIHTLSGYQNQVVNVALSPNGKTLASWSIAFGEDGKIRYPLSEDTTIKLWDVETDEEIHIFAKLPSSNVCIDSAVNVALSPDGKTLASWSYYRPIQLWNIETKEEISTSAGHEDWVESIAFSPDGKTLAFVSKNTTIKLWNVETDEEIHSLAGYENWVGSIAFSPDGKTLASVSGDTIQLWNVDTGKEIYTWPKHQEGASSSIAFSPDGKTLASVSGDTIQLWNVKTQKEIYTLTGHQGEVSSIAFTPDGKILASGSDDNTIKLWNVKTKKEIHSLTGHRNGVSNIAFSPDGKILASGSYGYTFKLWNVETGKEIQSLTGHQDRGGSIAFSPNGKTLVFSNGLTIYTRNLNFNQLLQWGCNQVYPYLKNSANLTEREKKMCQGIVLKKN
ncbi:MAG: hypothetical protein ACRCU2_05320, partial [Planktothrix sp.]